MPKKSKEEKINKVDSINNRITKQTLFYCLISIIDIVFIIYCARHNYANYVKDFSEESFFIGDSKDLLFGKNYITIIFTIFVYTYLLLCNKILFHMKQSKKRMIKLLIILFIINISLFFIFTKRIY